MKIMSFILYNKDCLDIFPEIEDKSIDLILCDLPYGTTKCKWDCPISLDKLWEGYKRIIKTQGVVCLFGDQPFTSILICSNLEWFRYQWIWKKNKTTGYLLANYRPMKQTEDIIIFSPSFAAAASKHKGNMTYNPQGLIKKVVVRKNSEKRIGKMLNQIHHLGENNKLLSNKEYQQEFTNYPVEILEFSIENDTIHPTQKPISLCEYLIKTYSNENDLVLDNCMGSGTTGIACIKTNRNFIGVEMEKEYFDLAEKRIIIEQFRKISNNENWKLEDKSYKEYTAKCFRNGDFLFGRFLDNIKTEWFVLFYKEEEIKLDKKTNGEWYEKYDDICVHQPRK